MSGKLDQSLDEILSTRKNNATRPKRRVPNAARTKGAAPIGGVRKNNGKPGAKRAVETRNAEPKSLAGQDAKIAVSNLPLDATEAMIKEYFSKSIGPIKKVIVTYGPNGQSRGMCTIIFAKPGAANQAFQQLNGTMVDKRPLKIEVVVDPTRAPTAAAPASLAARVTQTKPQPKKANAAKPVKQAEQKDRVQRGRNAGRPKKKTAEELDAEMTDYFGSGNAGAAHDGAAAATNGNATAANGGDDLGMDEIS